MGHRKSINAKIDRRVRKKNFHSSTFVRHLINFRRCKLSNKQSDINSGQILYNSFCLPDISIPDSCDAL